MGKPRKPTATAGPGHSRTGSFVRTIENAEQDTQAARLRATGMSHAQIARVLGYADESGARRAVQRALAAVPVEAVEELRTLEAARLDHLLERLAGGIDAGDVPAIESARKISESRRRLFGLDGPIQINMTETTQADLAMQDMLNEARAKAAAERAKASGDAG